MDNKYEELANCKDREEYLDQRAEENGVDRNGSWLSFRNTW